MGTKQNHFAIQLFAFIIFGVSMALSQEIYMSNSTHILKADILSSQVISTQVLTLSIPEQFISRAVGLAIDGDDIFYSDIDEKRNGIYRVDQSMPGLSALIVSDVGQVNGLAVDWINKHIYWTDAARRTIEVADYTGQNRRTLVYKGLSLPRAIIADPKNGYLFWNDQGTRRIVRSSLDGSNQVVIVDSGTAWPNQMAIHYGQSKLYWVDAWNQTLESCDLDGANWMQVADLSTDAERNTVFGLAIHENVSYVSVWQTGTLLRVDLNSPYTVDKQLINIGTGAMFSLVVNGSTSQPDNIVSPCGTNKNGCSHLCLPLSMTNARCACPSKGIYSLKDSSSKTCQVPEKILMFALADNGIVGFTDLTGNGEPQVVAYSPRPVAISYDSQDQMVYWSDVKERSIRRAKIDGTNNEIFLNATESIGVVDGMDIDIVSRRLYFSNMGYIMIDGAYYTWHKIETVGLDGANRKTVVNNAEKPRAVKVDARNRHLYFSDWGTQAQVVRADLDGLNQRVIKDGLNNPNGILLSSTSDMEVSMLVIDSHHDNTAENASLYLAKVKTSDATTLQWYMIPELDLKTPYGLAKDMSDIFISDWKTNAILKYDSDTTKVTTVLEGVGAPMALLVVYLTPQATSLPTSVTPNQCVNTQCSGNGICFAKPANKEPVCACSNYNFFIASITTATANMCKEPESFILTSDFNTIKMVPLYSGDTTAQTIIQGNSYTANYVGLTFDTSSNKIYFSDVNSRIIYSANRDGSGVSEFYKAGHVIDSMTVTNQKLYWTDYQNGSIASVDLIGQNYQEVVTGLDKPRAILVTDQHIYWSEWGNNTRVARTDLNGSSLEDLLITGLVWPNVLWIKDSTLYVADGKGPTIMSKSLSDGSNIKTLSNPADSFYHVYGMAIARDMLYISDWKNRSIASMKIQGDQLTSYKKLASYLMRPCQIFVVDNGPPQDDPPKFVNCPTSTTTRILARGQNYTSLPFSLKAVDSRNNQLLVTGVPDKIYWSKDATQIVAHAKDSQGREATPCTLTIDVKDTEAPMVKDCPADRAGWTYQEGEEVSWQKPTATDNVEVMLPFVVNHNPGYKFPVGATDVTYRVTDSSGNVNTTCSFKVTVTKYPPPKKDEKHCLFPGEPQNSRMTTTEQGDDFRIAWSCVGSYRHSPGIGNQYRCSKKEGVWKPTLSGRTVTSACYKPRPPKYYTLTFSIALKQTPCNMNDQVLFGYLEDQVESALRQKKACSYQAAGLPFRLCEEENIRSVCEESSTRRRRQTLRGNEIKINIKIEANIKREDVFVYDKLLRLIELVQNVLGGPPPLQLRVPTINNVTGETDVNNPTSVTVTNVTKMDQVVTCEPGQQKYRDGDQELCAPCPTGSRFNKNGSCTPCGRGTYQEMVGQSKCVSCPDGTTSPEGSYFESHCRTPVKQTGTTKDDTGLIGGIIGGVAAVLVIAIVCIVVFICWRRRRGKGSSKDSTGSFENPAFRQHQNIYEGIKNDMKPAESDYATLKSDKGDEKLYIELDDYDSTGLAAGLRH